LGALRRKGGTIVAGSDAGVGPAKPHDVLPLAVDHFRDIGFDNVEMLTAPHRAGADPSLLREAKGVWRGGRRVV
jgi:hypothetical protein